MSQSTVPQLSQSLRRLTARYSNPSTDHELLQRFVSLRDEAAFIALVECRARSAAE